MADTFNLPRNYRVEVSGWGLDNVFFVEKTDLHWSPGGDKHVVLHRALPEGTTIFVRLLATDSMDRSAPVAFQVEAVDPMDRDGQCDMRLMHLLPRLKKAPKSVGMASYMHEDSSACELNEGSKQREEEEILQ